MLTGETANPREVESVAKQVLALERTALRRAWGVLYAVAAVGRFAEGSCGWVSTGSGVQHGVLFQSAFL